ncbi:MAG TPA: hypothetical protein VFY53_12055, partial [Rhodoplanes sp.]|nr:hypothetical protein [Rhodoplanes sp.]
MKGTLAEYAALFRPTCYVLTSPREIGVMRAHLVMRGVTRRDPRIHAGSPHLRRLSPERRGRGREKESWRNTLRYSALRAE